jgi:UDP-N-acetylmuramate: L-alanyl-gamma-D-glutamyl-meso-diaminopimelate ligase
MTLRISEDLLARAQRVHVLGISGTAMGTFARMLTSRGYTIRGSDAACYPPMSDQLAAANIEVKLGYAPENLEWGPDLVVVGNVIRRDNPEMVEVVRRGLPYVSFPELFGHWFLAGRRPVVITGTHGKTTTTSLTAWLLEAGGQKPGLLVGGVPVNFGQSFLLGDGAHFVVEGDEYDTAFFDKVPKFLHYRPAVGVITNIEFDHADIYANVEAIEAEFTRFAALLPEAGRLIVNAAEPRARRAALAARCPVETFGLEDATWQATDVASGAFGYRFTVLRAGEPIGRFTCPLPGVHNLQNALAAIAVAVGEGLSAEVVDDALGRFASVKKRQEVKGVARGVTVVDDFAHHPTAVRATVRAMRERYVDCADQVPRPRLFACFEIESNTSRRRVFQDDYAAAFDGATAVLFCRPLEKADNLPLDLRIDLDEVVAALRARGIDAQLIPEVQDIVDWLSPRLMPGDVVLGMSGRHFYGLHDRLLGALRTA